MVMQKHALPKQLPTLTCLWHANYF